SDGDVTAVARTIRSRWHTGVQLYWPGAHVHRRSGPAVALAGTVGRQVLLPVGRVRRVGPYSRARTRRFGGTRQVLPRHRARGGASAKRLRVLSQAMPSNGRRLETLGEASDQRPRFRDCLLDLWKLQRRGVAVLAVPDF